MTPIDIKLCKHLSPKKMLFNAFMDSTLSSFGINPNDLTEDKLKGITISEEYIPYIHDLHKWMNDNCANEEEHRYWQQSSTRISIVDLRITAWSGGRQSDELYRIPYDSSKKLIDQSYEVKEQIVNLLEQYEQH